MTNKNEKLKTKQWWEDAGIRFECIECGNCCGGGPGFIWVNDEEKALIAQFLNIDENELKREYLTTHMGRCSIKEQKNYDCIFLDSESKRCKIYEVRPKQCSIYPFWTSLLENRKIWDYYAERCPGMDKGKHYTAEMIRQLVREDIEHEDL